MMHISRILSGYASFYDTYIQVVANAEKMQNPEID